MELKGKVALVTGAGKRVGRAITIALADRGASLAVHFRSSKAEADEVVEMITKSGGKSRPFRANLEDVAEIERMMNDVLGAFGRIDVLVNCASVFYRKPI